MKARFHKNRFYDTHERRLSGDHLPNEFIISLDYL